jgi:Uma2 family endonuclease
MEARDLRRMTLAEYLELDRSSDERWEYVDGSVFVVAARPDHNLVKGKVYLALSRALEGRPCLVFPDGQKISTRKTRAYHYPDASVFCGPLVRDPDDDHALENPTLLLEVLSPSTADYDRGGKFVHYRSLVSLREYVIVSIEARLVERYRRLETGEWLMTEFTTGDVELSSIDARIRIEELWSDLERLG